MSKNNDKALIFSQLHAIDNPLILFNIWDAGSAKAIEQSGAKAIATSSWAMAASHGFEDGENLPFDVVLKTVKEIVASVSLPVSVDFESGYGASSKEIENNIFELINCGAVGINFEDYCHRAKTILPVSVQEKRLSQLKTAAEKHRARLFINARTDIFLSTHSSTHDTTMLKRALERAVAYKQAGADCFFVPGLLNKELIQDLCTHSPLPVNIMVKPTDPSLPELAELKVARISFGAWPYNVVFAHLKSHYPRFQSAIKGFSAQT